MNWNVGEVCESGSENFLKYLGENGVVHISGRMQMSALFFAADSSYFWHWVRFEDLFEVVFYWQIAILNIF